MKRLFIAIFALFLIAPRGVLFSQTVGNVTGIDLNANTLRLRCGADVVVFKVCTPNVIMVNLLPNGIESPDTVVVGRTQWSPAGYSIDTTAQIVKIQTSKYRIDISRNPMRFSAFDSTGAPLFNEPLTGGINYAGAFISTQGGNFYGLHNKQYGNLSAGGGGTIYSGSQGEAGAPFIWTPKGWGMLADMDTGRIDITANQVALWKAANQNKKDIELYFIFGSPKEILGGAMDITGKPPLFPKFTLGFLNTEWGIDQTELLSNVGTYRAKGIPLDSYVLDFDWMAWGQDNYGEFKFGPKFPAAPGGGLKNTLLAQGVKMMGIRKPRVHRYTVQGQYAETRNFFLGYKTDYFSQQIVGLLNFHRPDVRQWYWNSFITQGNAYNDGLIGYWNDEADEFGGSSMFLQMQRSEYEGQRQYNNRRVWSINRNFLLGAQRYAYALWSGDIGTGFGVMAAQTLFMNSSILLGASWWGMDIGGFNGTPDPENYYRWIQFGAFVPVFRVHGTLNQEREPWNYGPEAEAIATKFIKLRYRLLPYIYSLAWENHNTGISLARPLVLEYPDDANAANISNEWLFGNDLLVKPILTPSATSVSVYLPQGTWIDYWSGARYYGPSTMMYPVNKDIIPLFVKAGSVIPCMPPVNYSDDPAGSGHIILSCYPSGGRSGYIYEDDGITYNYEQGMYSRTDFSQTQSADHTMLNIGARTGSYPVPARDYLAEFHFFGGEPDTVFIDNIPAQRTSVINITANPVKGWAFDSSLSKVLVRLKDDGNPHSIAVKITQDMQRPLVDSVYFETGESIVVAFNETVQTGQGANSAENIANYGVNNGMQIIRAAAMPNHKTVKLTVSPAQSGRTYTLTVQNIADASAAANILLPAQFSLIFIRPAVYTVVLQDGNGGYSGTGDTHIAQNFPDNNMGGYAYFEACRYGGGSADDKSTLIRFDLSGFTGTGDSLMKAEIVLTLAQTRNGTANKVLGSYRVLKPWNEGTVNTGIDGGIASTGMATWRSAQHSMLLWANEGGDFEYQPSDIKTVGSAAGTEYAWDITNHFKSWRVSPDSNFGIIIREPGSPSTQNGTKVFYSRENELADSRPKLRLTYKNLSPSVVEDKKEIPTGYLLSQNYPNPFNPATVIRFALPNREFATLKIFDVLGNELATLVNGETAPGVHEINFNAGSLPSGLYFYRLTAGKFSRTMKMNLIK